MKKSIIILACLMVSSAIGSQRIITGGETNQSVVIHIMDSSDGTPETAVAHDTSGIDLWYWRIGSTKTSIVEASLAALDTAHTDGGFEPISNGEYRLDLPDAAVAAGVDFVHIGGTVTGMIVVGCTIEIGRIESDVSEWSLAPHTVATQFSDALTGTTTAEAVWDAAAASYVDAGTIGKLITDIETDTAAMDTAAELATLMANTINDFWDEAMVDLSAGDPVVTETYRSAITRIWLSIFGKVITDGGESEIHWYNDAGTKISESDISDVGGDFTKAAAGVIAP